MVDRYFKRPLIWDYSFAIVLSVGVMILYNKKLIVLPKEEYIISIASDLSNVSLTLAGFILTLLTVLITFKSGSKVTKDSNNENDSLFELFFATDLYFQTVKHLKNCTKSLIVVTIIGYTFKLSLNQNCYYYIYFSNIFGLVIIILTLWRSLLILTRIINLQKTE